MKHHVLENGNQETSQNGSQNPDIKPTNGTRGRDNQSRNHFLEGATKGQKGHREMSHKDHKCAKTGQHEGSCPRKWQPGNGSKWLKDFIGRPAL